MADNVTGSRPVSAAFIFPPLFHTTSFPCSALFSSLPHSARVVLFPHASGWWLLYRSSLFPTLCSCGFLGCLGWFGFRLFGCLVFSLFCGWAKIGRLGDTGKVENHYSSFRIATIPQILTLHDSNVEVRL